MTDERQQLIDKITAARQHMMRASGSRWAGPWNELDLTIPQIRALGHIAMDGPSRMSAIAQYLGISMPSCTSLVDRLSRAGMVDRQVDPSDRRLVICTASEQ